jgi:hypothetical protein
MTPVYLCLPDWYQKFTDFYASFSEYFDHSDTNEIGAFINAGINDCNYL